MRAALGILGWILLIGVLSYALRQDLKRNEQHDLGGDLGQPSNVLPTPPLASPKPSPDDAFERGFGMVAAQSSSPSEVRPGGAGGLAGGISSYAGHGDFEVSEERFVALAAPIYRALELDWEDIPEGWTFDGRVYSIRELRNSMCGDEACVPEPERMLRILWERDAHGVRTLFAEHQDLAAKQAECVALLERLQGPREREGVELQLSAVRARLDEIRCAIWSACGDPAYRWLYELDKVTR